MSVKGKRTIWVGPADQADSKPLYIEHQASESILPGSLVKQSTGTFALSDKAATVFDSQAIIAAEYGDHIDKDVDTAYASGEVVLGINTRSGEFVNALVVAAATLTKGAALSSNGDGTLKVALTDGTEQILFYSDEALTVGESAELVRVYKA